MFSLIMAVFCSTSIALTLKFNSTKKGNEIVLLSANYLMASIISFILLISETNSQISIETLLFGSGLGLMFVTTFFSFAKAVETAGTALAAVSSRLSVLIPITLAIIIYNEIPNFFQAVGFAAAFITLYFFYRSLTHKNLKKLDAVHYLYLAVVLIGIGFNDFLMKVFNQWRPAEEKSFFLLSIFGSAFIYTASYIIFKKQKLEKRTISTGLFLGIPNVFSSFFLIDALKQIPAIIVFPSVNISIIILTAIGAFLIWKESLNAYGRVALLFGIISIGLLSL
ncbi:MAG: hypothetical protein K8F60_17720 [Melioribacteraceae bacterium]|nr:hypothetical protein [Melioribacteraceae bacterium]